MNVLFKLLKACRRSKKYKGEHLYYLNGIKPINADRKVIDECTVTK